MAATINFRRSLAAWLLWSVVICAASSPPLSPSGFAFAGNPQALGLLGVGGPPVSGGAGTTVTFSQKCSGSGGNCIWGATPAAGSQILILVWGTTSSPPTAISDGGTSYGSPIGYANATNFESFLYVGCNSAATGAAIVTIGGTGYIVGIAATGGTTSGTGCNDASGPSNNNSTTATTAISAGAITTTNAHDLLVNLLSNGCGSLTFTPGTDGHANSMVSRATDGNGVLEIDSFGESATNTYTPTSTLSSGCRWNAQSFAIK